MFHQPCETNGPVKMSAPSVGLFTPGLKKPTAAPAISLVLLQMVSGADDCAAAGSVPRTTPTCAPRMIIEQTGRFTGNGPLGLGILQNITLAGFRRRNAL